MLFRSVCVVFCLFTAVFGYNHPEIEWKTVTTEHFRIHFYDKTESSVYATWKIAEEAYSVLSEIYNYQVRDKISISLANYDDYSNGWADWTSGCIMIWIPDSRFDLRSNTTWLRNVITHELAHIVSLEAKKKMQLLDIVAGFNISTPDEQITIEEPFARVSLYPAWLSEGIAQYEAEALGQDCWDSRREMVLRSAILENKALSLEEMAHFNHDMLGNEMAYNQGFAFSKYIAEQVGSDFLRGLFRVGASEVTNVPRFFAERAGKSLPQLYQAWTDSLRQVYSSKIPANPTPTKLLWGKGTANLSPEVSPDGNYLAWFTDHKDDAGRTDLIIAKHGSFKPLTRIQYAHTANSFSPQSDKVYFLKSRSPNKQGSFFNDIYCYDLKTGKEQRLTRNARVYDLAALPGAKGIACVRFRDGAFGLELYDLASNTFSTLVPGTAGEPCMHLATNPQNPDELYFSKIVNGISGIYKLTLSTKDVASITSGVAQEETPYYGKDGRIYFSADYDGIFNIYSVAADGTDLKRHTRCTGGLFSPSVGSDGTLFCSRYSASGFSIVEITPESVPYQVPESYHCTFKPLPAPKGKVTIKSRPYEPQKLRSLWEMHLFGDIYLNRSLFTKQYIPDSDTSQYLIGAQLFRMSSDALQKKTKYFGIGIGLARVDFESDDDANGYSLTNTLNYSPKNEIIPQGLTDKRLLYDRVHGVTATPAERVRSTSRTELNKLNSVYKTGAMQQFDDSEDEDEETASLPFIPIISPVLGWESRSGAATTGLELSAQMVLIFPQQISAITYAQWQVARDLQVGLAAQLYSQPFFGVPLCGAIPLMLSWQRVGYINQDIHYNYADVSYLTFMAGPSILPALQITHDQRYAENDTTVTMPTGLITGIDCMHSFSIAKYASLQVYTYDALVYNNKPVMDNGMVLDGVSRTYFSSQTGVRTVFPIVRTINRRCLWYWDALYGNIGYTFSMYTNGEFFDSLSSYSREIMTDKNHTPNAEVGHFISAGFEMGHYKTYLFFKRLSFDYSFEILRKINTFTITAGM